MSDNVLLKSYHQIDDEVLVRVEEGIQVRAYVRGIIHTKSKVKYTLYLINVQSVIQNVDSALVEKVPT
jgi:hypothetical protein